MRSFHTRATEVFQACAVSAGRKPSKTSAIGKCCEKTSNAEQLSIHTPKDRFLSTRGRAAGFFGLPAPAWTISDHQGPFLVKSRPLLETSARRPDEHVS